MRTVTIKDVAARAGVSPKTVSRVINGEQHVRPEVRAAVLRVVAELDYRPNAFARSLSSSRSFLLGLFFDDPASGYAADVQLGALRRCRERSHHLVVETLDAGGDWRADVAESLRTLHLGGAILTPPVCDWEELHELLDAHGVPFVRISPSGPAERSGLVRLADRAAARDVTRHLIGLGHRRIAFVKGNPTHSAAAERFAGFRDALDEAGLAPEPCWEHPGDFTFRSGLEAGLALLAAPDRPSAVFASNDEMAFGVLVAAMRLGIAVPDALSIAGFDDAPLARMAWPQLTTVRQPNVDMAAAAVDILVAPEYRAGRPGAAHRIELPYQLIVRASTAAPGPSSD